MAFQASWVQRQLAEEFAALREATKMSTRDVGDALGWSHAKVARIESAQNKINPTDASKLAKFYKLTAAEVDRLCEMAAASRTDTWWSQFEPWLSESYNALIGYENEATRFRSIQPAAVPGLLQSRDYAESLIKSSPSAFDPDKADALIEVRLLRQRRLHEDDPLILDTVIAEAVLHWAFGGTATLHQQLRHLREMSDHPNVTIRVVPFLNPIIMLPLEIYELGEGDGSTSVAFSETLWTNSIHEGPLETKRARRMFDQVESKALSPVETTKLIEQRIRETK